MRRACRPLVVLGAAALVGAAFGMLSCKLGTEGLGPPQADGSIGDAPSFDSPQEAAEDDAPPDGGVDAMALCLSRCTLEGGICEPSGNGGVQCSVYCNTTDPCVSVACPPGLPCYVDCQGTNACSGGVDCSQSSSCDIVCGGSSNCGDITCGGTDCKVVCQVPGACANAIDCVATDSCNIQCFSPDTCLGAIHSAAQTTTVTCDQAGTCTQNITCGGASCSVSCSDGGACAGGECCDAGSCMPRATQICP
jgi:hypothetical protein